MAIVTTTRGRNGSGTPSTPIQTKDIADNAVTRPKLSEDVRQSLAAAAGAVRYDAAQELTTEQKEQSRTNIAAMANTPSGDPMHYIYETAGAEWIPYANISTEGLEDWQVETLDRAQAQADGGVWWHNDIFVTVEQNRINYVYSIGNYPTNITSYQYYLNNMPITTNYKQIANVESADVLSSTVRNCNKIIVAAVSNMNIRTIGYSFSYCEKLCKIVGVFTVSEVSVFVSTFKSVPKLRHVLLKGLNCNIDFSGSPLLSINSILYMIRNAGTATFTITLASAVYAAAMADADVQSALAAKPNVTLANAGATGSGN